MISYDLRAPGRDYQALYDELASMNAVPLLESQWLFPRYNTSCISLRNHYQRFIDANDGLLVAEFDGADWAGYGLTTDPDTVPR